MDSHSELSEFLRAARARLRPEDVGVEPTITQRARRVSGLRRDEVARLAGVSVDYYARLEQGRTGHVGESVLRAVAAALRMNDTERDYFFTLTAGHSPLSPRDRPDVAPERLRPGIQRMLESFTDSPAFVVGRGMSMLGMNTLAKGLLFDLAALPAEHRNLARWTFLDPDARERYVDWEIVASDAAAILRKDAADFPDDRALRELIGELSISSAEFRQMWNQHNVYECTWGSKRLFHPVAGRIDVDYEALDIPATAGQKLFTYTTPAGSPSEAALRTLQAWTVSPTVESITR